MWALCGSVDERSPDEAPYAVNHSTDFTAKVSKRVKLYECKRNLLITSAKFANKKPWIVPLNIEGLNLQQINKLPMTISLYNQIY